MIDVILEIMNAFLFDEFMLWIWGPWSLLAILNGYLIADGFDSVEEALGFFGTIALIGGGLSLFTRESFLEGAFGWVKSTIMGFVLAFPCIYLLPVGWRIGTGVGLGGSRCSCCHRFCGAFAWTQPSILVGFRHSKPEAAQSQLFPPQ